MSINAYCCAIDPDTLISSGPASIIYNEGGQRAEEDDLDDDEPVASAYVSRGPSPPAAVESQLPVPERSYLEVPNATTSVRSSKSRGSPPEFEGVDKGKGPQNAASGSTPSRSVSTSRGIPGGLPGNIELPGPIALTDSNSSRRSGSGRLGDTLTSIWGNNPPSAGPSANSSGMPSPLEGPSSRGALLNALKPLASVPEGSAIPEVVHVETAYADTTAMGGVPEFYRASPPKTPKAETPHASASLSHTPVSASVAATSPKPAGTPKAASRIPTAAGSPRPGGTPRGLSIYSNVAHPPPAAVTPKGPSGSTSPARVAPSTEAPPEPFTMSAEPPTTSTPKHTTRTASPKPPSPIPPSQSIEPSVTESAMYQPDPALTAPEPHLSELTTEPITAEPAVTEEDPFSWGQRSKAGSRKGSKAGSKAGSKPASKVASKAPTPKGAQTPKPAESTSEEAGAGLSAGSPAVERKPSSGAHSPLTTVPEDHPTEPVEAPPGNFFVANPDQTETPDHPTEPVEALPGNFFLANPDQTETPDPPAQPESTSFSSFGGSLGGSLSGSMGQGLFGTAASALGGWGFGGKNGKKEDKSKPPTPKTSTPAWGGFGSAPSVTESTGGSGGWGAATGNNGGSGLWTGLGGGRSATGSTADLLTTGSTVDPLGQDPSMTTEPLGQYPAENGESYSYDPLGETHAAEGQEGEMPQGEFGSREPLTLQTDVAAEAGADTAEPTTAADESPEVEGRGGDGGQGEEEETGDISWGYPMKTKKKKEKGGNTSAGASTPAVGGGGSGGGDDGFTTTKKKKGKKGGR